MNKGKIIIVTKTLLSIFIGFPVSVFLSYIILNWMTSSAKELALELNEDRLIRNMEAEGFSLAGKMNEIKYNNQCSDAEKKIVHKSRFLKYSYLFYEDVK